MYDISYFKASGDEQVFEFMRAHPFIILCGADNNKMPVATHIPVLIEKREDKYFLLAHVMKKQAHTESFRQNNQVLAIFYGPSTYVSASWYENKKVASTWNYQAVHAKGLLRFLDDQGLKEVLTRLTDKFENNSTSPALVQKMDNEYLTKMMQAIVAFEIELTDVQHVFKLSQNRDERSHANIIQKLKEKGGDAEIIAKTMESDAGTLFGSKEEGRP
jgi:transcriptional regulator